MISRTSSMPVCEAASISITSTWRDSMIAWQCTPNSGHVDGGPVDLAGHAVVERPRQNARGRRLADAAHAGQDVGLVDAAGGEGVGDRAHHRLLADQILEAGGPIFARQHAVGRRALRGRRSRLQAERGLNGGASFRRFCFIHARKARVRRPAAAVAGSAGLGRGGGLGGGRRLDKDPPWLVRAASFRT